MLSTNATQIERALLATLLSEQRPTEQELVDRVREFRHIFPIDDDEHTILLHRLQSKIAITMEMGTSLTEDDYTPWLLGRKVSIDQFFWDRFRALLGTQGWPPLVVSALDRVSDEILDLAGDPTRVGTWKRRGLVVGDVQSGKTATYTALCCKAADAGYRLVILLTGTIESLRRQTQERLDEGFVGLDSSEILQTTVRKNRHIGVGLIDRRRTAGVFTSRSRDFSRNLMTQLGFRIDSFQEPVLVVLKKNKRILENFENWVRSYNAGVDDKIEIPLLLIDDEADSASINTNDSSNAPTAINKQIRQILALFRRSSYVGVTATPFANVFINPDTVDEMIGDDLFPRDYIYALEPPTNYLGPERIFITSYGDFLQYIDDADLTFPSSHRSAYSVPCLPNSLISAMYTFVLATAIRNLNSEGPTHRSMLVNVSRFTSVQNQVAELLFAELRELQREVRMYASQPSENALMSSPRLSALHQSWLRHYSHCGYDWQEIQVALNTAAQPITVKAVNQMAGTKSLDYKAYKDTGLRVIAVGGNSLSRGLTLEGLTTSYFYRNSQMYDTLLQMGRWFGYRDGYENLCRLWLTDEAANWYTHITAATEELRFEFKRMKSLNLTPKEFGLKVRSHPDSLIVTARNKMRSAETIFRGVSLSGMGLETAVLRSKGSAFEANVSAASRLIQALSLHRIEYELKDGTYFWRSTPKDLVVSFLSEFVSHPLNFNFQNEVIAQFLKRTTESALQHWDIVLPSGVLREEEFAGLCVRPVKRILIELSKSDSILISGKKKRLGSGGIERFGLTAQQMDQVKEYAKVNHKDKAIPDSTYRKFRDRPLLLIYLVRGFKRSGVEPESQKIEFRSSEPPMVAIGLSFPNFDDSDVTKHVEYRVNMIQFRAMFDNDEIDDDSLEDNDDDDA